MHMKMLVVDDEKLIVKGIKFNFEADGFTVLTAYDGEEAVETVKLYPTIDIIILDLMLPKMDGHDVLRAVREYSDAPVIMLTSKSSDEDKILGLELGADDYVTKPFNILELKARVHSVLRRQKKRKPKTEEEDTISAGGLVLYENRRRLKRGDVIFDLTSKEFDIMHLFMSNPGRIYSRDHLLNAIWGYNFEGDTRTVDVHMRRLREKIEISADRPEYILTKWGVGYYFKDN